VSIVPFTPAGKPEGMNFLFGDLSIRALLIDGEPWFVAADVANALGYARPNDAYSQHVTGNDRSTTANDRGGADLVIVNESGLYSLIFGSKLAAAKTFQRWVTSEVLPLIRKTGQYVPQQKILSPRELAQMVIDAEDRAAAALVERDDAWAAVSEREEKIRLDAPKVGYVEHFVDPAADHCTVRTLATELGVSERKLFSYLLDKRRIYRSAYTREYQPYADWKSCFTLRDQPEAPRHRDGRMRTSLFVTPVGKESIRRWLAKDPIG